MKYAHILHNPMNPQPLKLTEREGLEDIGTEGPGPVVETTFYELKLLVGGKTVMLSLSTGDLFELEQVLSDKVSDIYKQMEDDEAAHYRS